MYQDKYTQQLQQLAEYKELIFNTGFEIHKHTLNATQRENLKTSIPHKTIIAIDGLASTGKSVLCKNLNNFGIAYIYSGAIWRAVTYIFEAQYVDASSQEAISKGISQLHCFVEQGLLKLEYQGRLLEQKDLNNNLIDTALNTYNCIDFLRASIDVILEEILCQTLAPQVIDLRGNNPTYLQSAQKKDYRIIKILLFAEVEEKITRRIVEYTHQHKVFDQQEVAAAIVQRDINDLQSYAKPQFGGLITPHTAILNTTPLTIQEVFDSILYHIAQEIEKA
jgi:cytidylate kinase